MHKLLFPLLLLLMGQTWAQTSPDSTAMLEKAKEKARQDSSDKAFLDHSTYPLIKSSPFSGVIPVVNIAEKPDPKLQYKLLLEVVNGIKDTIEAKKINNGFAEAGRVINLHYAAGIPAKNLHLVMIVHGGSLHALLKNEAYRKLYKTDNPNFALFKELQDAGVQFIACGQALFFLNIRQEDLVPGVKVALSAKTTITSYQMKGYVLHPYL